MQKNKIMSIDNYAILAVVCAIIVAKWAKELGYSQLRQLIWGIAALLLGPIVLLILYVRLPK